jgi:hypothetical protein
MKIEPTTITIPVTESVDVQGYIVELTEGDFARLIMAAEAVLRGDNYSNALPMSVRGSDEKVSDALHRITREARRMLPYMPDLAR